MSIFNIKIITHTKQQEVMAHTQEKSGNTDTELSRQRFKSAIVCMFKELKD